MKAAYSVRAASLEEFSASREAWNAIVQRMRYPTPFVTWEWVYTWWEHFGRDSSTLPIFVYRGERLAAILPVFSMRTAGIAGINAVALEYGGGEDLFADHLDIICAPEETEACGLALMSFLANEQKQWDVLRIPMIAEHGGLRKLLWREGYGFKFEWTARSIAPYVALPSTFDGFMAQLPRKDRHTVRSQHRKAFEEGVSYANCAGDELENGLNHLFELHEKRASQKGINSTFAREDTKRFHYALARRLSSEQFILRILYAEGKVIACLYAFRIGNRTFLYQLGYDPDWSRLSPGVAIITENIRESIEAGCTEYNFLQGDEPYKRNWARRSRRLLQFHLYNRTFAGRYLQTSTKAKNIIRKAVRRWIPRLWGGSQVVQFLGEIK